MHHTDSGRMRGAVFLLLMVWTPGYRCQTDIDMLRATLGGTATVVMHEYNQWEYEDYISSWCRQLTEEICDDLLDNKGAVSKSYKGRATMERDTNGSARVTITGLREWDTGLYCWRIWTGNTYQVLKKTLLQVVTTGLDPSVLHRTVGRAIELKCSYDQAKRWSKVWCKKQSDEVCDWIVHSDKTINPEYVSRAKLNYVPKVGRMMLFLFRLQLWDTGAYWCQESGGSKILCKILLVVSHEEVSVQETEGPPERTDTVPTEGLSLPHAEGSNHSAATPTPSSRTETRYLVWDVVRWILLLVLIACSATTSCFDKMRTSLQK